MSELQDALDTFVYVPDDEATRIVVEAARKYANPDHHIWWCQVHDTQANVYYDDDPQCVRNKEVPPTCRIVKGIVLLGVTEDADG